MAPAAQAVALISHDGVSLEQLPQAAGASAQRWVSLHRLHRHCVVGGWGVLVTCCTGFCWVAISERYRLVG